jgi:protein transport protein SEC23
LQRNQFPPNYSGISQTQLPAELMPQMTTIEYQITKPNERLAPAFLFVVDTCLREEELQALKDSVIQSLDLMPENSNVGLITYGTVVQLWQLTGTTVATSYAFSNKKAVSSREVFEMLGLGTLLKGAHSILRSAAKRCGRFYGNLSNLVQYLHCLIL